jgi:spermidine synthase
MQRLTDQFFTSVRQRLAPGGVVAANVVYRDTSPVYDLIVGRMTVKFGISEIDLVPGGS